MIGDHKGKSLHCVFRQLNYRMTQLQQLNELILTLGLEIDYSERDSDIYFQEQIYTHTNQKEYQ